MTTTSPNGRSPPTNSPRSGVKSTSPSPVRMPPTLIEVEAWVIFTHGNGRQLRRPIFWDGGPTYYVRFASTQAEGEWQWSVHTARPDHDFKPARGTLAAGRPSTSSPSSGGSWFCHRSPVWAQLLLRRRVACVLGFDTAWAMPFRATVSDVAVYAADRQAKGFNAVLLMSVQPDMNARGPVGRNVDEGFEIGFHDLSEGQLTKINVEYFRYLDKIIDVLINHGITPVLQPLFHGFGWKGPTGRRPGRAYGGVRPLLPLPGRALRGPTGDLPPRRRRLGHRTPDRGRRARDPRMGRLRATHRHPLPAARPQRRPPGR